MEKRVDNLELDVSKLESDMTDVKTRLIVAEHNIKDVKDDLHTIKDDTRWLRRTLTSSIIGIVIAAILAMLKLGGV